jgi:hypothetical protein
VNWPARSVNTPKTNPSKTESSMRPGLPRLLAVFAFMVPKVQVVHQEHPDMAERAKGKEIGANPLQESGKIQQLK